MDKLPKCLECNEDYTYLDGDNLICPMCGYSWQENDEDNVIKDVNGNILFDGDSVIVVKDLKVKGGKDSIKIGTKVKNIKLIHDAPDGHDISCKVDGFGSMFLKSSVVKKN